MYTPPQFFTPDTSKVLRCVVMKYNSHYLCASIQQERIRRYWKGWALVLLFAVELHLIMHRNIGLTGYIGTLTLDRLSVSQIFRCINYNRFAVRPSVYKWTSPIELRRPPKHLMTLHCWTCGLAVSVWWYVNAGKQVFATVVRPFDPLIAHRHTLPFYRPIIHWLPGCKLQHQHLKVLTCLQQQLLLQRQQAYLLLPPDLAAAELMLGLGTCRV